MVNRLGGANEASMTGICLLMWSLVKAMLAKKKKNSVNTLVQGTNTRGNEH